MRIDGGPDDDGAELLALAFLDLRFDDGHVERWLGPGAVGTKPAGPDAMVTLQAWARERTDEHALTLMCEVAIDYDVPSPSIVDSMACEEVVVEWNAPSTWT